jgi:putative hydrolase of the HAD superfamily
MATQTLSQSFTGIKAITFDVGGTLIEPWPSVGQVYAEVAARHGLKHFSAEQLNTRFKTAWRARPGFAHSRNAWEELVNEVFGPASMPPGFFADLYDQFAEPHAWRVFDDVVPTLEALVSRKIKLAVISNWDERLRPLLHKLKLGSYFEALSISLEVGFPKPSPTIFKDAAAKLGLAAGSILHVGDSFEMDVAGAKAAGFQSLRIHRSSKVPANTGIHSLTELIAIFDKLKIE